MAYIKHEPYNVSLCREGIPLLDFREFAIALDPSPKLTVPMILGRQKCLPSSYGA